MGAAGELLRGGCAAVQNVDFRSTLPQAEDGGPGRASRSQYQDLSVLQRAQAAFQRAHHSG
ncbi:MAG: hypothetical protein WBV63_15360, partial [Candidatus Sulfotelmatobacter sp.]